jgi:hypothetical protein
VSIPKFFSTLLALSAGALGISAPPLLSRFELHSYPFFSYPHWSAYLAFSIALIAAALCRTPSEQNGVLFASVALSLISTFICWDVTEFNFFFAWTRWYGPVLDYIIPLTTLVIATPALFVILSRRIFSYANAA